MLFSFLFAVSFGVIDSMNITLISMMSINNDAYSGFLQMNPVYDLIVRRIQHISDVKTFVNFTHIPLPCFHDVNLVNETTGELVYKDHDVANCFFEFYYKNEHLFSGNLALQFTILTTPSFDGKYMEMPYFILDTKALLALSYPDNRLANNTNFPTTLNLFATPDEYFTRCLAVLARRFLWTGVNVVCDVPSSAVDKPFLEFQCANFAFFLQVPDSVYRNLPYTMHYLERGVNQTYGSNSKDFVDLLRDITETRACLVLLEPRLLRNFMVQTNLSMLINLSDEVAAYHQNMTNGQYVFLTYSVQGIPSKDDVYWRRNDEDDLFAVIAFRALLVIPEGVPQWNGSANFLEEIRHEYAVRYNWTNTTEDLNAVGPTRILELLTIVTRNINENLPHLASMTMTDFVKSCINRTYHLPSRTVMLNKIGTMIVPISITRLSSDDTFQTYSTIDLIASTVTFAKGVTWFGQDGLPPEIPVCGLQGERCPSKSRQTAFAISLSFVFALITTAIQRLVRIKLLKSRLVNLLIDRKDLPETTNGTKKKNHLTDSSDLSLALLGAEAVYYDRPIYIKTLASGQSTRSLTNDSDFSTEVVRLSRLRHPYVAEFIGISLEGSILKAIYERPLKGALTNMLRQNTFFADIDLRLTLIGNLIEGLQFIHTSDAKYHGLLSSQVCLLSDRYTIRIVLAGLEHLDSRLQTQKRKNFFRSLYGKNDQQTVLQHQKRDVHSLGLIMSDIFANDMPDVLRNKFRDCLSPDATQRPTATRLLKWAKSKGLSRYTVVELLLNRLHAHALTLEDEVALRSQDLVIETRKVDDLLNEMLPKAVIHKLRNHEAITAELYDSATILFSDIPVFPRLVAECPPMDMVIFLNQIHSLFDMVVAEYDAYKVETINDSYVVVSGIPLRNGDRHAAEICRLALRLRVVGQFIEIPSWGGFCTASPRIGINSGLAAAGIVGTRMPRYCLFGDTMNTASRMESHGAANKIHVTTSTRTLALLYASTFGFSFTSRGLVNIKGKGYLETYWLSDAIAPPEPVMTSACGLPQQSLFHPVDVYIGE